MSAIFYSDIQNSSEVNTGFERVVYKVPRNKDATVVINATNTYTTSDAIRIAIKDYDKQIKFGSNGLNLDTDFMDVNYNQIISSYTVSVSSGDLGGIDSGTSLSFSGGATAKVLKSYEDNFINQTVVTEELVDILVVDSMSNFAIDDQIQNSGATTVATVVGINASASKLYVQYSQGGPFTNEAITSNNSGSATITSVSSNVGALFFDGLYAGNLGVSPGELYKFDISSAGLNGFNIYSDSNLTSEYLDGVSIRGQIGVAGSFVLLQVTSSTPTTLYYGDSSYGENILTLTKTSTSVTGNERTLLLYDVNGTISTSETFTYSSTSYTVSSVNVGAYGRINRYVESLQELKVFVDYGTFDEGEIIISPLSDYYYPIDQIYNLKIEDHIEFDLTLDSHKSIQRSAIVLGSEYSVVTLSDNGYTNFNVYGFEE